MVPQIIGHRLQVGRLPQAVEYGIVCQVIAIVQGDQVVCPAVALVDIIVMAVNFVEVPAIVLQQTVVHAHHALLFEASARVPVKHVLPGLVDFFEVKVLTVKEFVETGLVPGIIHEHPVDGLQRLVVADDKA